MSFSVETLPGEPIIVSTVYEDFSISDHIEEYMDQLVSMLDSQSEPVYYISDVGHLTLNLDDLVISTNASARGNKALLHHPNIRGTVIVTNSRLFKLAVKGLDSDIFGNVHIDVFETIGEALAFVRNQNGA